MTNVPSGTTDPITIRMRKDDLVLLDLMVEHGGFSNRGECLRAFIKPAFEMAKEAMRTKSVWKSVPVRFAEEKVLMDHLNAMAKASEVQGELFGDVPSVEVSPA
jgi:hypothetical protein